MGIINIDDNTKGFIFICLLVGIIIYIGFGVYNLGASNMCKDTGGILLKDKSNNFKCINISSIDICRDNNKYITKPNNGLNFTINWSG